MEKERFEQLEERVRQLEREVELLKQPQGMKHRYSMSTKTVNEPKIPKESRPIETKPVPVKEKEPVDWEQLIGRVWLPRIFIFVLLMGLVWGFKVAVDYGILTEPIRVVLGFAVAVGLYFFGERQVKNSRLSLGKSLLVGAIGILILTTFAMNVLYGMVPTIVAFSLNIIWVAFGLFLAYRHQSQVIAILIAFVGYLIPFLVVGSGNILVAVIYETIYYAVLVYYSIARGFKQLFYVAAALLHVVYVVFMIGNSFHDPHVMKAMALGAIVQHVIIFYAVYRAKFNKMFPIPFLFTIFIATTLWVKLGTLQDDYLYATYLIIVTIGYAVVVYVKKKLARHDIVSVALSISTFAVFLLLFQKFQNDDNVLAASFLLEGVIALYLGFRFKAGFQKVTGVLVYIFGAMMILFTHISEITSGETFVWILFILTLYGLIYLAKIFYEKNQSIQVAVTFVIIFGHILFFMQVPRYEALFSLELFVMLAIVVSLFAVYRWTKKVYAEIREVNMIIIGVNVLLQLVFLTDLVQFMTERFSDNISMMAVSFSWALYATISVILGIVYNKKEIRLLGIGLLLLTLCKLIFVDLQYVSIVVRAILFIGLGAIGIVLSRLLYVKK